MARPKAQITDSRDWFELLCLLLPLIENGAAELDTLLQAFECCERLVMEGYSELVPELSSVGTELSACFAQEGDVANAINAAEFVVRLNRDRAHFNPEAFLPDLAGSIDNLGIRLSEAGRYAEALTATEEAVAKYRELEKSNSAVFLPELAGGLNNLGIRLSKAGRHAEALTVSEEAVAKYRELEASDPGAFLPDLARSLSNLGNGLCQVGRRAEALTASEEAVAKYRELETSSPEGFLSELAGNLANRGITLSEVGRYAEALTVSEEAVAKYRELEEFGSAAFLPDLARSLDTLSITLSEVGRYAEALTASEEAVAKYRELEKSNSAVFLRLLAGTLSNLGITLSNVGRRAEALTASEEAVAKYRELEKSNSVAFLPELAMSLSNLGNSLSEAGRRAEALHMWREQLWLVVEMEPTDPHRWVVLAKPVLELQAPQDLRESHLPLLRLLTEHRELAFDTEHADVLLAFQGRLAAHVWALLPTLPSTESDLAEQALADLVSTLHSPDLSRWLQAQGAPGGSLHELARLKRDVVEADQVHAGLMQRLQLGGPGPGTTRLPAGEAADESVDLRQQLAEQAQRVKQLREAFRAERRRLVGSDPQFRSAFQVPTMADIRDAARRLGAGAVLCLLELPEDDSVIAVGALVRAGEPTTQLVQFDGLSALARQAGIYKTSAQWMRGTLRDVATPDRMIDSGEAAEDSAAGETDGSWLVEEPAASMSLDELQSELSRCFWDQLGALDPRGDGAAPQRLHICTHGLLQQLPLVANHADDPAATCCAVWPGLPYLRRAAALSTPAGAEPSAPGGLPLARPWLVGHDCAWGTERPLPMVAVEVALIERLLRMHGHEVQPFAAAEQLQGDHAALVMCCHGRQPTRSTFDAALILGSQHVSVGQILSQAHAPQLALLPACHAGETREDQAGNALGLAAAFLMGGSRVTVASSKAVPDSLMPWLSTLMIWHVLKGLPLHEAARLAREQFATLAYPAPYRHWLRTALPQALETLAPGGAEYRRLRARDLNALDKMLDHWPWQGDGTGLLSEDSRVREQATTSLADGVLLPRVSQDQALLAMREVASFVFVYGVA